MSKQTIGNKGITGLKICFFIFILVAGVFGGCSKPYYYIKPEAKPLIRSTDIVLAISQSEINAEVIQSDMGVMATGGGAIGALIDMSITQHRAKKAEEGIQPVRDALVDYNFPSRLASALAAEFRSNNWAHVRRVIVEREVHKGWMQKKYEQSDASAVLFVEATYRLSYDFNMLLCNSKTGMFPKEKTLAPYVESPGKNAANSVERNRSLYRNDNIMVQESLTDFSTGNPKTAGEELAKHAPEVRKAMDQLVLSMAKSIVQDLNLQKTK